MRWGLLLACSLLIGCSALPNLKGSSFITPHYQIDTDNINPDFAFKVAGLAEHFHGQLANFFGSGQTPRIPIFIFTDRAAFDANKWTERSYGEYISHPWHGSFSLVYWSTQTLAHEQVHHFVETFLREQPLWKNEGLAQALDHRSDQPHQTLGRLAFEGQLLLTRYASCPLEFARSLSDEQIWDVCAGLDSLEIDGARYRETSQIGAALVRFGMETGRWQSLLDLRHWEPDVAAFIRWLRATPPGSASHTRFAPLLDSLGSPTLRVREF